MKSLAQSALLLAVLSGSGGGGRVSAFSSYLDMLGKLYGYDGAASAKHYSTKSGQDSKENMGKKGQANTNNQNAKNGGYQVPADGIRALPTDQDAVRNPSQARNGVSAPSSPSAADASPELSDQDYMSILNLLEEAAATSMSSLTKEQVAAVAAVNGASDALLQPDGGAFRGARWGSDGTVAPRGEREGTDNLDQVRLEMEAVKADLELLRTLAMEVSSSTDEPSLATSTAPETSQGDEAETDESLPSSDRLAAIAEPSNSAVTTDISAARLQGVAEPAVQAEVAEGTVPSLQDNDAPQEAPVAASNASAVPETQILAPEPVEAKIEETASPPRDVAVTGAIQEVDLSAEALADSSVEISAADGAEPGTQGTSSEPTNVHDSSLLDDGTLKAETAELKNGSTKPAGLSEPIKAMSRREKRRHRRDSNGSTFASTATREENGSGKASSAETKTSPPSLETESLANPPKNADSKPSETPRADRTSLTVDATSKDEPSGARPAETIESVKPPLNDAKSGDDVVAERDPPKNSPLEADYRSTFVTRPPPVRRIGVKWNSTVQMGKTVESSGPAKTSSGTFGVSDEKASTDFVGKVSTDPSDGEADSQLAVNEEAQKISEDEETTEGAMTQPEAGTSLDTSEENLVSTALATSDVSTAALVEELASEAAANEPGAAEAMPADIIHDTAAKASAEVPAVDEAEDKAVDPVLASSIAAAFSTADSSTTEDAPFSSAGGSTSDVETSVDAAEALMETVALKTTTASVGLAAADSVSLGSTEAVTPQQVAATIKKTYSGFGIKPKVTQPFVGKSMPAYKVETRLVSESDKETSVDSEPASLHVESTNEALIAEEKQELLSPPSPTPIDFEEQLTSFSATTAASEVRNEKVSSNPASGESQAETQSEVETALEADVSYDLSPSLSIETSEDDVAIQAVTKGPSATLLEQAEGESPKVVLTQPPDPSSIDMFDQLSSFSTTTAATESVDHDESINLDSSSNEEGSEGAPNSFDLPLAILVDTSLPPKDADSVSSIDQVVDLIQEAQALTEQEKFDEAEAVYTQALNAINAIDGPGTTSQAEAYVAASKSAPALDSPSVGIDNSLPPIGPDISEEAMEATDASVEHETPNVVVAVTDSVGPMIPGSTTGGALESLPTTPEAHNDSTFDVPARSITLEDSNEGRDVPVHRPFFLDVIDSDVDAVDVVHNARPSSRSQRYESTPIEPVRRSTSSNKLPIPSFPDSKWFEDAVSSVQPFVKSLKPLISGLIDGAVQMVQNLPKPRVPPAFEADPDDVPNLDTKGMTERIMKRTPVEGQATGAGGASTWDAFQRVEKNWKALKESKPQRLADVVEFVTDDGAKGNPKCWQKLNEQRGKELDYDVVICGGTLGIFFATALRLKGHRVAVLEAGKLRGREQEWNLSMDELQELVKLGVLKQDDVDAAVTTEFPGCRSGFKNKESTPLAGGYFDNGIGYECYTPNVLNLGVTPSILLERAARRFRELGGVIMEETRLEGVVISEARGAAVDLGADAEPVTAHLVLDCMGNASPISRQQRRGAKPDGVCAVVGSCASGFDNETNILGDIIYTNSMIQDKGENGMLQYFWEAFPVGIGRNGKEPGSSDTKTTYMFTYMDANEKRPSMETLMEDYWRMLPKYQPSISNPETDLDVKRVLFAYFPTYRSSPLQPRWSRILAVGDASGIQSPLSFGGFGALTRHLDRISTAVSEALEKKLLDKDDLAEINAYLPNLSASWMFQKAMSVKVDQKVDPTFVNRLLATNFEVMDNMGQRTIKPFLQDVVRFDGLVGSLARSFVADPGFMPDIVRHVGVPTLVEWLAHVSMMGAYGALDAVAAPLLRAALVTMDTDDKTKFQWRRRMEAWKYGSGSDYRLPKDN